MGRLRHKARRASGDFGAWRSGVGGGTDPDLGMGRWWESTWHQKACKWCVAVHSYTVLSVTLLATQCCCAYTELLCYCAYIICTAGGRWYGVRMAFIAHELRCLNVPPSDQLGERDHHL